MTRLCLTACALAFLIVAGPAMAQSAAKPPSMTGKVVTKKKLAECKKQAKEQKLGYIKRRKFVRECVKA
jgi:hypothetical protein